MCLWTAALALSAYGAYDSFTWLLEVAPAIIPVVVLVATHRRFPLTGLLYALIFVHSLILMLGGHYTYERVPLGYWIEQTYHFSRNHYDRIGHFAQGFIPARIARELFLRHGVVRKGPWLWTNRG